MADVCRHDVFLLLLRCDMHRYASGFKGKDKKAQEKMQLTQGLDAAQFARDHVTYQSYGLGAALEQVRGRDSGHGIR